MTSTAQPTAAEPHPRPAKPGYKSVYLWHWPIRAMHWFAAGCVAVLVVTGFYIGKPYFIVGSGEASAHFLMGWMRFLHFSAAGLLVATGVVRVYWLFVGNRFERWQALFPIRPRDWKNMYLILRKYMMIRPDRTPHWLGHNPLQQLGFTVLYLVAVSQVVTGFTMYGLSNPGGFFAKTFAWVAPLFGGIQVVRFVHHVLTWYFLIFFPIHVYLSLRADLVHREARISSIVGGFRFVREDVEFIDE